MHAAVQSSWQTGCRGENQQAFFCRDQGSAPQVLPGRLEFVSQLLEPN